MNVHWGSFSERTNKFLCFSFWWARCECSNTIHLTDNVGLLRLCNSELHPVHWFLSPCHELYSGANIVRPVGVKTLRAEVSVCNNNSGVDACHSWQQQAQELPIVDQWNTENMWDCLKFQILVGFGPNESLEAPWGFPKRLETISLTLKRFGVPGDVLRTRSNGYLDIVSGMSALTRCAVSDHAGLYEISRPSDFDLPSTIVENINMFNSATL